MPLVIYVHGVLTRVLGLYFENHFLLTLGGTTYFKIERVFELKNFYSLQLRCNLFLSIVRFQILFTFFFKKRHGSNNYGVGEIFEKGQFLKYAHFWNRLIFKIGYFWDRRHNYWKRVVFFNATTFWNALYFEAFWSYFFHGKLCSCWTCSLKIAIQKSHVAYGLPYFFTVAVYLGP